MPDVPDVPPRARVLSVAGSDSGGGAGIQADLKTFAAHGAFGMTVLTAVTAQNTVGVSAVHEIPPAMVRAQLEAVVGDIGVDAVKTGMLGSARVAAAVAAGLRELDVPVIVDPVAASKHGDPLIDEDALVVLREEVLPLAEVVTPNLGEVTALTGVEVRDADDLPRAAEAVLALGPRWVLVKGGHLPGGDAVDLLASRGVSIPITATRVDSTDTHGTGCTLSSAIAAQRAAGSEVEEAVRAAKEYVTGAIAAGLRFGRGVGPVDHGWRDHPQARLDRTGGATSVPGG